jgi:carbon-monoxide dehydrogenase medium subunit
MGYHQRLPKFEYLAPPTVGVACAMLARYGHEAKLLAGGTDLVPQMRRREVTPRYVIGLKSVSELASISEQNGHISLGAMTTFETIAASPVLRKTHRVLSDTAAEIGSPEIRQVGTIGGNLAGALPCADLPPVLLVLGAKVKLQSKDGERLLPLDDFFINFEQTVAQRDELLTEIHVARSAEASGAAYLKFHDRHSMDMTTTGVAVFTALDEAQRFREVKIALSSSAPVPTRVKQAEDALAGRSMSDPVLEQAASLACVEAAPRGSWRARRDFRLELIRNLTKRAVRIAWQRAAGAASEERP